MVDRWFVETEPDERFSFYTRANIGEVFPDPVAPLTFSWFEYDGAVGASEWGFRDAYERIGVMTADELPPDRAVFLGVFGGYGYLNASALRLLGHRAPGMTAQDIDDAFFGDAPGVPPFAARPEDERPELTARIGETFQWVLTTPDLPDVAADEVAMNHLRRDRPDLPTLSDRELVDHALRLIDTHFARLFSQHIYISFLATLPVGMITKISAAIGRPTDALKLIAGLGDVESAAPAAAMWQLGRVVAASPELTARFDRGLEGLHGDIRSLDDPAARRFTTEFDAFLVRYGSRGPNEWELRSPTWETHPDLALAAIDRMRLSADHKAPLRQRTERAAERERLGAEIRALVAADPETAGQFDAALHSARVFLPGRERTKTNCIKLVQEARMALYEFGRRCVTAGTLPAPNLFSLLTRDELTTFLDDPTGFRDLTAERAALLDEVVNLQEPFLFDGEPPPMSTYPRRDENAVVPLTAGDRIQGVPGCPGTARGVARVVLNPADPTALGPDEILIAPITDPSWTPLFVPAAAVVVDVGAPLSHAVIVSRELGIPCVVSATDSTRRIPDGATIEVDGDTGTVTVVTGPEPHPG
ncbi:MAG: PEP-utilizing enzyme [Acidimicrobiales bacterium]